MKRIVIGSVMALAMAAVACGGGDKDSTGSNAANLKVSGTVDSAGRSLDNASAIAIGSDGRTFSAYLDRAGKFSLELPVGHVYRIIIANGTMSGGLHPVGHLVNATSRGNAEEIAVKEGGTMNLGRLHPAGTTTTAAPRSLHVLCGCSSDDDDASDQSPAEDDSGDDYKTQQKDTDKDNLCDDASSDVDLVAENAPGDKCAKDEDDEPAPKPAPKACTDDSSSSGNDKSGSSTSKSDPAEDDSDWDTDEPTPSKDGSDEDDSSSPSKSSGDACSCSSQCGGESCIAGKCTGSSSSSSKGGK